MQSYQDKIRLKMALERVKRIGLQPGPYSGFEEQRTDQSGGEVEAESCCQRELVLVVRVRGLIFARGHFY
jgi:hypothetical protein